MVKSPSNEGVQEVISTCECCFSMEDQTMIVEELQQEKKSLNEENKILKVENFVLRIFLGERMMLNDKNVEFNNEVFRLLNLIEESVGDPYTYPGFDRLKKKLPEILFEWKKSIGMDRKTAREDHDIPNEIDDISPPDATKDPK